jgi:hypothetical protein
MHAELEKLREQYQDDGSVVNFNAARARKVKLKMVQGSAAKTVKTTGKAFQTIPSGNQLDPSYKPLTLGGFVKSGTGQGVLIAQGGESLGYALALEKGVPVFMMRAQGVLKRVEGEKVDARDFVHLVVKLDADGVAQILVNGEPSGKSVKLGLLPGRPADGLSFGADSGSLVGEYSAENGMIGEVRDLRLYWGVIKPRFLKSWMNGNSK